MINSEIITSLTHLYIFVISVVTAQLEHQSSDPGINVLLADSLHHLRQWHPHPLCPLGRLHEEAVEHGHALTQHGDLQLLLVLKEVNELLQSHLSAILLHTIDLG